MKRVLCLALLLLVSCGPERDTEMHISVPRQDSGRFQVERVAVFADDLSYGGSRGIYVITDRGSGQQFVGVSGVGISELGSHKAGKATVPDER